MSDVGRLMGLLADAHFDSAMNNEQNLSSSVVKQMGIALKTFPEAVASAVLTLGGVHAPVTQARHVIFNMENDDIVEAVASGMVIPGFGNAFHKDGIDPAWVDFEKALKEEEPDFAKRIDAVADIVNKAKGTNTTNQLFPNPAAYTAAVAELLGMPEGTEVSLLVNARMRAWVLQWAEARGGS